MGAHRCFLRQNLPRASGERGKENGVAETVARQKERKEKLEDILVVDCLG
jgi:hypothetical protein